MRENSMQVLVKKEVVDASDSLSSLKDVTSTGTCVLVEGQLVKTPEGTKQVGSIPQNEAKLE